jgi:calcineurin-like phosphoesterase family protein
MNIFITSDEHYGHERIIQYVNRPFTSVEEQTETMIERHNKAVPDKSSNLTIHAGDMFWNTMRPEKASEILYRLHGKHAFIYGNHDELLERTEWMHPQFEWMVGTNKASGTHIVHWQNHTIVINHFAMRTWEKSHKGSWHVFGHSHQELPPYGKSFDIGVEGHNYAPWSLEEIAAKMETLPDAHAITGKVWVK